MTVTRGGTVASDAAFDSIVLIDSATDRRIGNTKTLNSTHEAIFNDDITVKAGTTKTIYLGGNMISSLASYAGQIPSLNLKAVVLKGSAAVIGTLPIVGNYMQLDGTVTIGTLTLTTGSDNPSASTQKIGTSNYVVTGIKLSAGSAEDFNVTQIAFNQGGTASDADVKNVDLKVDGATIATVANPVSGDVVFDLRANPLKIEKGKSKSINLELDIVSGSSRTIRFDLKKQIDISAKGLLYGYEVALTQSGVSSSAEPYFTGPVTNIDKGSLRVGPATLTSANVPNDTKQVVLGKFEFEAKGEAIQITRLPVEFLITTSSGSTVGNVTQADLTNVSVYDENGVIVAGPSDTTHQYWTDGSRQENVGVTTTDTITIPVGTHIYTVKADISADWEASDTIVARIKPSQMTAKGDGTGLSLTPTPATEQTSATMTVRSAALAISVSSLPIVQNVVAGTKGYTFANIVLDSANSGEDVKVTQVVAAITVVTANAAQTSNWKLFDGTTELAVTNDPSSDASNKTSAGTSASTTFTLTTPLVIAKGTSKTLTIKADISSAATTGSFAVGLPSLTGSQHVTAKGANSGVDATITMSASNGQAQTISSKGELTVSRDSSSPKDGLIPANTSGVTLAVLNAFARYEKVNIEKIYLTGVQANSGGWDQVNKVYLYNGSTKLAEVSPTSSDAADRTILIDVTNNPIAIAKDTSVLLTIKADTAGSNYEVGSKGASGQGLWVKISASGDITAKGDQSGSAITTLNITNASSTAQYLFKSVPTVSTNDLLSSGKIAGGTLQAGTESNKSLYAFSVTADSAGDIGLHHIAFNIATSSATITNMYVTDGITNVAYQPSSALSIVGATAEDLGTDTWSGVAYFPFVNNQTAPTTYDAGNVVPYVVPAGTTKTFTLKGDVQCAVIGGSNCSGTNGSGSASLQFLGDNALPSTLPNSAYTLSGTAANVMTNKFMWTDFWRTSILQTSSTTASNTEQWSTGYLVALSNGGKMIATSTAVTFSR
jgi:hypothetical protein